MTVSARQLGGGGDHTAADSLAYAPTTAADYRTLVATRAPAGETTIDTDPERNLDGAYLGPANDPLMRAIEIGLAGLAFGSAVLLAFMR